MLQRMKSFKPHTHIRHSTQCGGDAMDAFLISYICELIFSVLLVFEFFWMYFILDSIKGICQREEGIIETF